MMEHKKLQQGGRQQLARDEASAYFDAYVQGRQDPMRGQLPLKNIHETIAR